jgi:hypothetical protein
MTSEKKGIGCLAVTKVEDDPGHASRVPTPARQTVRGY